MGIVKGSISMAVIAISTIAGCIAIYIIAILGLIMPTRRTRSAMNGCMDGVITCWVAVNAFLIRVLSLIRIDLDFPDQLSNREVWWVIASNHQSWADIILIQATLLFRAPPIKFFTKRELIWIPLLGFAMWLLRFPYVRRFTKEEAALHPELYKKNQEAMDRAGQQFMERPIGILAFLEGTRFTEEKRRTRQSPYKHLLAPRIGGLSFVLDSLHEKVEEIVDVTLVYQDFVPGFWDFFCGRCPRVLFKVRTVPVNREEPESLRASVEALWEKKDNEIELQKKKLAST